VLTDLGIPFTSSGKYFKVRCVSGLHADVHPSLLINQKTGVFFCPACDYHGNIPQFVARITGKAVDEVYKQLVENPQAFVDEHTVAWKLKYRSLSSQSDSANAVRAIRLNASFLPVKEDHRMFWEYLSGRGLTWDLIRYFDIRCCLVGYYNYRVIVPVIFNKRLVSFVARDILREEDRFEREPDVEEYKKYLFPAGSKMGGVLFNYDNLNFQDVLYLVEGVFDVFSLWVQGYKNSTCVFGKHISDDQAKLLKRFRNIVVIPDQNEKNQLAGKQSVTLMDLAVKAIGGHCNLRQAILPKGLDPGGCKDIKKYIDQAAEWRPNPKYFLSMDYSLPKK
jgi:DNA primase